MGLLDKDFTENFELGFNDIFSLQRTIEFPVDIVEGKPRRPFYNYKYDDIVNDAEKLSQVKMVTDSKGRLRPDHNSLIQTVMDKFVGICWKEIIWDAKPYVSVASSGDKIYFTIMTKRCITSTYNKTSTVCRIICAKK